MTPSMPTMKLTGLRMVAHEARMAFRSGNAGANNNIGAEATARPRRLMVSSRVVLGREKFSAREVSVKGNGRAPGGKDG